MKQNIFTGILLAIFMWEMGRCTSAYFAYKKWRKYYVIENEFLQKICIRNRIGDAPRAMDKNKLRQPAFIIYAILIPSFLILYSINMILQLGGIMNNKMMAYIRLAIAVLCITAFFLAVLIVIIDAILTEKRDKRFF